jgi:hypothetical protein
VFIAKNWLYEAEAFGKLRVSSLGENFYGKPIPDNTPGATVLSQANEAHILTTLFSYDSF